MQLESNTKRSFYFHVSVTDTVLHEGVIPFSKTPAKCRLTMTATLAAQNRAVANAGVSNSNCSAG